jgi:hypothetical protein
VSLWETLTTPNTHLRSVDLLVQGPTKYKLVIKSKTAKAHSLIIPTLGDRIAR